MQGQTQLKITIEDLRKEFDIKYRQLRKLLLELYEKSKGLVPEELRIYAEIPSEFGEKYKGFVLFDEGEICVEIDVSADPNRSIFKIFPLKYWIEAAIEKYKPYWSKRRVYEHLHEISEQIPYLFMTAVEELKKQNKRIDEKLMKIQAILSILQQ